MTLVEKLVRCYSPSGQEEDAVRLFLHELTKRSFQAHRDDVGNAIGIIGQGSIHVFLVGHIDTVTNEIPVRAENGQLFGRGSVDAKGSLAVFTEAAAKFADSKIFRITVIGCVREETDSNGARHILATHNAPAYVVIGEPSGWDAITLGYRGCITLRYNLKKPQHHRGTPELTPAEEAIAFYQALCDSYPDRGAGFKSISIKLTEFNTSSGTHESVKMCLDVRTPLKFDLDTFNTNVRKVQGRASVTFNGITPAVSADRHNALVRAFLGGIRSQGGKPTFKYKTGTSDMNLLSNWKCPILTYGPGISSLDHTVNEHLDFEEYELAISVLTQALRKLSKPKISIQAEAKA